MTLWGAGGRRGEFATLENRMANFPSWVRSDMTNVQGGSDGQLTNAPDNQVSNFFRQPCADKSKTMAQFSEVYHFVLLD